MDYILTIRKEAETDIEMNFQYYEEIRDGLGHDFLSCLDDAFLRIKNNPLVYREVYKRLRRVALKRFPYRVLF